MVLHGTYNAIMMKVWIIIKRNIKWRQWSIEKYAQKSFFLQKGNKNEQEVNIDMPVDPTAI